jgi:hypothetical protein
MAQPPLQLSSVTGWLSVPVPNLPFGALYRACRKNDLTARLNLFEGGSSVLIKDGNRTVVYIARQNDDLETAPEATATWLIQNGFIQKTDLD